MSRNTVLFALKVFESAFSRKTFDKMLLENRAVHFLAKVTSKRRAASSNFRTELHI